MPPARPATRSKEQELIETRSTTTRPTSCPIIADIDAGFGNAEATYLLAKKMIEAGACALQIENQVSDEKQCGHQDGKVTVPHEDFLAKIRACRYAFLELGVDDGIIVARTDSLGAGLTKQIAVSHKPGDLGDQYNSFLDCEEVDRRQCQQRRRHHQPRRQAAASEAPAVATCTSSAPAPAKIAACSTASPRCRTAPTCCGSKPRSRTSSRSPAWSTASARSFPNAKLVYNNSPSFNWTLNFRQQVFDAWKEAGKDVIAYDRAKLMSVDYDDTDLAIEADERIRTFQRDARQARRHLPPPDHAADLSHGGAVAPTTWPRSISASQGMLGYVKNVQRKEIRQGIACVKHQNMSGSDIGDDHKEYFAGEAALKAGGAHNTMNQFG